MSVKTIETTLTWTAFEWPNKESHPKRYGKYFVQRNCGKIHWETWNGASWAYNANEIAYWAEVTLPKLKTHG